MSQQEEQRKHSHLSPARCAYCRDAVLQVYFRPGLWFCGLAFCCAGDYHLHQHGDTSKRGAGAMHPYRRVDISMMFSRVRYVRSAAVGVVPARGRSCRPSRWRMRLNCDWELVLMNNTRQLGIKLSKTTQRPSWPRCTENSTFDADYMVLSSCTRPFHRGHSTMSSLNRPQRGHVLLIRLRPRCSPCLRQLVT